VEKEAGTWRGGEPVLSTVRMLGNNWPLKRAGSFFRGGEFSAPWAIKEGRFAKKEKKGSDVLSLGLRSEKARCKYFTCGTEQVYHKVGGGEKMERGNHNRNGHVLRLHLTRLDEQEG